MLRPPISAPEVALVLAAGHVGTDFGALPALEAIQDAEMLRQAYWQGSQSGFKAVEYTNHA